MASISDISNELIRDEIEEFIERPDERERIVNTFAKARASMQEIGAALIEGENGIVDKLTTKALEEGIEAIEIMDDGLIAAMGIVGIKFRRKLYLCPRGACLRPRHEGGHGTHRTDSFCLRHQTDRQGRHGNGER